jgi:S1-C subfamily serine protease
MKKTWIQRFTWAVAIIAAFIGLRALTQNWERSQEEPGKSMPPPVLADKTGNKMREQVVEVRSEPTPAPAKGKQADVLFDELSPSIVLVVGSDKRGEQASLGSGVVIQRGIVVTNCHVIAGRELLRVKHGEQILPGMPRGIDSKHDLCLITVLHLDAPSVVLGRTENLRVGQRVYAIGNPRGLELSLSDGLISSLRRETDGTIIQTTAPISPGSSGGGLFSEDGSLVGITTFQMREGQNLNFAHPVEWIRDLLIGARDAIGSAPLGSGSSPSQIQETTQRNDDVMAFLERMNDGATALEEHLSLYGETVDYYEWGVVDRERIRKDKAYFFRRWPQRHYTIILPVEISPMPDKSGVFVRYRFDFEVANERGRVKGSGDLGLFLKRGSDGLRIAAIKEWVKDRVQTSK